jgi:hypothetical protein
MQKIKNVACMVVVINAQISLTGKYEGKRPLCRPEHRWKDNIKGGLKGIEFEGV